MTAPQVQAKIEKIRSGETEPYQTILIDADGNHTVIDHEEGE